MEAELRAGGDAHERAGRGGRAPLLAERLDRQPWEGVPVRVPHREPGLERQREHAVLEGAGWDAVVVRHRGRRPLSCEWGGGRAQEQREREEREERDARAAHGGSHTGGAVENGELHDAGSRRLAQRSSLLPNAGWAPWATVPALGAGGCADAR